MVCNGRRLNVTVHWHSAHSNWPSVLQGTCRNPTWGPNTIHTALGNSLPARSVRTAWKRPLLFCVAHFSSPNFLSRPSQTSNVYVVKTHASLFVRVIFYLNTLYWCIRHVSEKIHPAVRNIYYFLMKSRSLSIYWFPSCGINTESRLILSVKSVSRLSNLSDRQTTAWKCQRTENELQNGIWQCFWDAFNHNLCKEM